MEQSALWTHRMAAVVVALALGTPLSVTAQEPCDHQALEELTVVDMHAHFFNLRSVPLKGVFYRYGLPWPLAGLLADVVWSAVPEEGIENAAVDPMVMSMDEMSLEEMDTEMRRRLREAHPEGYERMNRRSRKMMRAAVRHRMELEMVEDPSLESNSSRRRTMERSMRQEYEGTDGMEMMLEMFYHVMRHSDDMPPSLHSGDEEAIRNRLRGVLKALIVFLSNEPTIVAAAMKDYPEVDVYIHHLLDLPKVYNDEPPYPFPELIQRAAELNRTVTDRKLHFFVGGDLFRRDDVFDLVKQGQEAGALGIKFYPPSGHRPQDTIVPKKPRLGVPLTATMQQRRQWKKRYKKDGADALDARGMDLFRYAADNDLAIFSHHNDGGFQAGTHYGDLMGPPCHWQPVLEKLKAEGKSLTVILAHAGGTDIWFSPEGGGAGCNDQDWDGSLAQQAFNLCALYENVYCDFGFPPSVLEGDCRENYAKRLEKLVQLKVDPNNPIPEDLCNTKVNVPPRFQIGDKIVYGSDWLVNTELHRSEFACNFDKIFQRPALKQYRAPFFGENALRALGLK